MEPVEQVIEKYGLQWNTSDDKTSPYSMVEEGLSEFFETAKPYRFPPEKNRKLKRNSMYRLFKAGWQHLYIDEPVKFKNKAKEMGETLLKGFPENALLYFWFELNEKQPEETFRFKVFFAIHSGHKALKEKTSDPEVVLFQKEMAKRISKQERIQGIFNKEAAIEKETSVLVEVIEEYKQQLEQSATVEKMMEELLAAMSVCIDQRIEQEK